MVVFVIFIFAVAVGVVGAWAMVPADPAPRGDRCADCGDPARLAVGVDDLCGACAYRRERSRP